MSHTPLIALRSPEVIEHAPAGIAVQGPIRHGIEPPIRLAFEKVTAPEPPRPVFPGTKLAFPDAHAGPRSAISPLAKGARSLPGRGARGVPPPPHGSRASAHRSGG